MSDVFLIKRLQYLKDSEKYSENAMAQFEKIVSENNGTLPGIFYVNDIGKASISKIVFDLVKAKVVRVYAPEGAYSPLRRVEILTTKV